MKKCRSLRVSKGGDFLSWQSAAAVRSHNLDIEISRFLPTAFRPCCALVSAFLICRLFIKYEII